MTKCEKFRRLRAALGISQGDMAMVLYTTIATVSAIERGHAELRDYMIEKLAAEYDIDPVSFADENSNEYMPKSGIPCSAKQVSKQPSKKHRKKAAAVSTEPPPVPDTRCVEHCYDCHWYGSCYDTCDFYELTGVRRGCPIDESCTRYRPSMRRRTR